MMMMLVKNRWLLCFDKSLCIREIIMMVVVRLFRMVLRKKVMNLISYISEDNLVVLMCLVMILKLLWVLMILMIVMVFIRKNMIWVVLVNDFFSCLVSRCVLFRDKV